MAEKKLYAVTGVIKGIGEIKKYTHAYSEAQAIKQVALDLQNKYPRMRIFIQEANTDLVSPRKGGTKEEKPKNQVDNVKTKKQPEQLLLFDF